MNSFLEKFLVVVTLTFLTGILGFTSGSFDVSKQLPRAEVSVAPSVGRAENDYRDWEISFFKEGKRGTATLRLFSDGNITIILDGLPDVDVEVGETKNYGIYSATNHGGGIVSIGVDDYNDGTIDWSLTLELSKFYVFGVEMGAGGAIGVGGVLQEYIRTPDGKLWRPANIYIHIPGGDSFALEFEIENPTKWKVCVTVNGVKECAGPGDPNFPSVCEKIQKIKEAAGKHGLTAMAAALGEILDAIGCNPAHPPKSPAAPG